MADLLVNAFIRLEIDLRRDNVYSLSEDGV